MKSGSILFIGLLLYSCTAKCPCSDEELEVFRNELENHHLRRVDSEEVACKKVDEFWRVSWEPINKQVPIKWDLFFDTTEIQTEQGVVDLGLKDKDFPAIKPVLRKLRRNGYDLQSASSKRRKKYKLTILDSDGSFYLSQKYQIVNGQWKLKKTIKSWKPERDTLDISQLR